MAREQIQINDLEPSIIGEDVTRYAIQIRGVDGNGNEGPWSTILEYESPELLPSLQSSNYVPNEEGWFLDNDGTFEVNDGLIRGTLQSANYIPNTSGWALDVGGNVEFSSGLFRGALQIGQNTFNVDPEGNLFIGGSSPGTAPFSVDTDGNILAMSIDAGLITAGEISADVVYAGTIIASQISSGTINGERIPNLNASKITEGQFDAVHIPNLDAGKITAGTLNANNVTISGTLSAVTLNGVSGTFSGNLSASLTNANTIIIDNTGFVGIGSVGSRGLFQDGNLWIREASSFSNIGIGNNSGNPEARMDLRNIPLDGGGAVKGMRLTSRNSRVQVDASFYLRPSSTSTATVANTRFNTVTGQLQRMTNVSSIRYKQDIINAPCFYDILNISPRLFRYREEVDSLGEKARIHYGLIAEELSNLDLDYFVDFGDEYDGLPEAISYDKISAALIPIIKELKNRIDELERKLNGS